MCKTVMAGTKYDDIRFDAARIMAETYKEMGEYALCKQAIDLIPEFFFTHREVKAKLLEGEDMFHPAWQQKCESIERYVDMTMRLADYYEEAGDVEKVKQQLSLAKAVIELQKDDIIPSFWKSSIYDYPLKDLLDQISNRLAAL